MKIVQHVDGVVVDIRNARDDMTIENVALVESIPSFEPKEGFNGVLMYGETGLYWDYVEAPVIEDEATEEDYIAALAELGVTVNEEV